MKLDIDIRAQALSIIVCWAGVLRNCETLRWLRDQEHREEFISKIEVAEPRGVLS